MGTLKPIPNPKEILKNIKEIKFGEKIEQNEDIIIQVAPINIGILLPFLSATRPDTTAPKVIPKKTPVPK